jgi:hypothetical protein
MDIQIHLNPEGVLQLGARESAVKDLWNPFRVRELYYWRTQGGAALTLGFVI